MMLQTCVVVALGTLMFFALETRAAAPADVYEAREYAAPRGRYKETAFNYRLMKPAKVETGEKYPLVVFLHGAGERGADNKAQLAYLPAQMAEPAMREKFPCFVFAPQCPADRIWGSIDWRQGKTTYDDEPSDEMAAVIAIIESLLETEAVDAQRVYLTGLSMGGYGTWELATRRPDLFAAAAPICGGGDKTNVAPLVNLPLWAWHGDADGAVNVSRSREMIAAIEAAGGKPRYTELKGVGHNSWTPAYTSEELLPWLFEQKRAE